MGIPFDVTFHPSWFYKYAGIRFTRDFFEDAQARVDADVKMRQALYEYFGSFGIGEKDPAPRPVLGTDLLAAGYLHSAILGCEILFSENNSPVVVCKNMTEEQIRNLNVPVLEENAIWQNIEQQIDYLQKEFGYVLPCINLMGVQNIAIDLRGSNLFYDYADDPELAHHLFDVCTRLSLKIGKRFRCLGEKLSGGVTAIVKQTRPNVYLTSNCTVELVSQEIYEEFLLPYDILLAQEFSDFGVHHCGQSMEHVAAAYGQIPNLSFAEVGAGSDLAAVRKMLPKVFLNARYSPSRLKDVSEKELQAELSLLAEDGQPDSLLSISCVGIDGDTSNDQIRAFLKACSEL